MLEPTENVSDDRAQLARVQRPVSDDLQEMQRQFVAALSSDIPIVQEVGTHLLRVGGKRFRPTLMLLVAHLGKSEPRERIRAAAAVELTHTATLVHDDVMDRCTVRRGLPTVNARWNDRVSLMMGDFLYSKAFALLAELGCSQLMERLAVCTHRMSVGEMLQLEQRGRLEITEQQYTLMVGEKTASLFGASCHMGAVLGGQDGEGRRRWEAFGESLGLAFQIIDDVFDFVGQERVLGKPVGNDLREGHATLPLIGALERSPARARAGILELIHRGEHLNGRWDEVVAFVRDHGGIELAQERANQYVRQAREALDSGARSPHLEALSLAVDYVIDRVR